MKPLDITDYKKIIIIGKNDFTEFILSKRLVAAGYDIVSSIGYEEINMLNKNEVYTYIKNKKPEIIINNRDSENNFVRELDQQNQLKLQNNIYESAEDNSVKKIINIGCYHLDSAKNNLIWKTPPTCVKTNELKFDIDLINIKPDNVYGPYNTFKPTNPFSIKHLIETFHKAKQHGHRPVILYGTGSTLVNLLYIEDFAQAIVTTMKLTSNKPLYFSGLNSNTPSAIIAKTVQKIVGHTGLIFWDDSKSDFSIQSALVASDIINNEWETKTQLEVGITETYNWFLTQENLKKIDKRCVE